MYGIEYIVQEWWFNLWTSDICCMLHTPLLLFSLILNATYWYIQKRITLECFVDIFIDLHPLMCYHHDCLIIPSSFWPSIHRSLFLWFLFIHLFCNTYPMFACLLYTGINYATRYCVILDNTLEAYKETEDGMKEICSTCTNPETCGSYTETCYCNGDLCNHGNKNLPTLAAAGFSLIALLLAKLM